MALKSPQDRAEKDIKRLLGLKVCVNFRGASKRNLAGGIRRKTRKLWGG